MAKSKIIKELANSSIDTMTALKRAKVLFAELGNQRLVNWINCELTGYPDDAELPDYRKETGNLIGTYVVGTVGTHVKYTNVSIPLGKMPKDMKDDILNVSLRDGIYALKQLLKEHSEKSSELGKIIPADFYPLISKYNSNPYMAIATAKVVVGSQCIDNVFAIVENRLLDALILLEKEFGNLDELDLDTSGKTPKEIEDITNRIMVIVYNDHSVTVGNDNTIKGSNIASVQEISVKHF